MRQWSYIKIMKKYLDSEELNKIIKQLSVKILQNCGDNFCLLGVRKGGVKVVDALAKELQNKTDKLDVGYIDVSLYRDDIHKRLPDVPLEGTDINFSLENKTVILVDEVLFTGRTIRAAIDQVMALGRPRLIRLVTLVNRHGRELPIQADYVGLTIEESHTNKIEVIYNGGEDDGIYFTNNSQIS